MHPDATKQEGREYDPEQGQNVIYRVPYRMQESIRTGIVSRSPGAASERCWRSANGPLSEAGERRSEGVRWAL